eukprot:7278878-Pyramimonas_sp.AAC.1
MAGINSQSPPRLECLSCPLRRRRGQGRHRGGERKQRVNLPAILRGATSTRTSRTQRTRSP